MKPRCDLWRALLPLALLLSAAFAADDAEDRRKPISIRSDRAIYEAGKGVYEGNVIIEQGTLYITADRVEVFEEDKTVDRLIAYGTPARFHQTDAKQGEIRASAETVEYRVAEQTVVLENDAMVDHQGSEIQGERIVYDSRKRSVTAEGDAAAEDGRIKMILQPRQAPKPESQSDRDADSESP